MTSTLILLRHGESEWNAKNLFTGWVDVDINEKGVGEAKRGAELLKAEGLLPDVVHTSVLRRAIHTAYLALDGCDRHWVPVRRSWRLNERHYGNLQGKNKAETLEAYGEEKFMLWRRSYDTPPPPLEADDSLHPVRRRALRVPAAGGPSADRVPEGRRRPHAAVLVRLDRPRPADGLVTIVVAHGNSLRALVKHLDGISDADIAGLNIPTGIPLVYELDDDLRPVTPGGRYLDPDAAAAAIEAVKNQGKK